VKAKSRLASVVDPTAVTVEAYVDEADLDRIAVGDSATFYAEADSRIEAPLRIAEIARASTRMLSDPALASVYGGPITVRTQKQNELIPDRTLYRVTLTPTSEVVPPTRVLRGEVTMRGEAALMSALTPPNCPRAASFKRAHPSAVETSACTATARILAGSMAFSWRTSASARSRPPGRRRAASRRASTPPARPWRAPCRPAAARCGRARPDPNAHRGRSSGDRDHPVAG